MQLIVVRVSTCALLLSACAQLSACAELPPAPSMPPPVWFQPARSVQASGSSAAPLAAARPAYDAVGVIIAGWHSGLLLPAQSLGPLRALLQRYPAARYLSVGWGNRRFYMAAQPGSGDALAALFNSPSVLLVQVASSSSALALDGQVEWLCVDRAELWKLDLYLNDSLRRRRGQPIDLGPGPLPDSRFYASTGHYDALHTCNTWTLAALEYAGLPVSAGGVLFAGQVAARLHALRACRPAHD